MDERSANGPVAKLKRATGALFAFMTLASVLFLVSGAGHTGESARRAGDADESVEVPAFTVAYKQLQIASEMGGVIAKVHVGKEGVAVKKDETLVELRSDILQANLAVSKARIASAELQIEAYEKTLETRTREYKRLKKLADEGVESEEKLEKAKLEMDLAVLSLKNAKAQKIVYELTTKRDEALLAQTRIKAPCDGRVLRITKRTGEAVDQHDPVLILVVVEPLYVIAFVPIDTARRIKEGMKAKIILEDGRTRECIVEGVDPVADPGSGKDRVKLVLENPGAGILAGTKGKLYFALAKRKK